MVLPSPTSTPGPAQGHPRSLKRVGCTRHGFLPVPGRVAGPPGLASAKGLLIYPWPYSPLPAPHITTSLLLFPSAAKLLEFQGQWWCFCFRDNCMCCPALPLPAHALHRECASAGDHLVWVVGLGAAGWGCCFERAWVKPARGLWSQCGSLEPSLLGIWVRDAQAYPETQRAFRNERSIFPCLEEIAGSEGGKWIL